VNNLAANPEYTAHVRRLSEELEKRMLTIVVMIYRPEIEMAKRFWLNGVQPKTAEPIVVLIDKTNVKLMPAEPDSSIGYRVDGGRWKVYFPSRTIEVSKSSNIEVKAVRYGWLESETVTARF
jgi:hypothetical protein